MTARPLTALQLSQLVADLNPNRVATRTNSGATLSYLEAWDIRTALIRVFGFGGFSYSGDVKILKVEDSVPKRSGGTQFRVTAMATVRLYVDQLECYFEESAVSSQSQPDPGECADFAVKTAESDALKRCAVNLGTQFGLSLYNKGDTLDVVKLTREPYQAEIIARLKAGERPSVIDADLRRHPAPGSPEIEEPKDEDRTYGYDPDHGTTALGPAEDSQVQGSAPGEDPRDDQPMALDIDDPDLPKQASPAARKAAQEKLRRGFDRSQS